MGEQNSITSIFSFANREAAIRDRTGYTSNGFKYDPDGAIKAREEQEARQRERLRRIEELGLDDIGKYHKVTHREKTYDRNGVCLDPSLWNYTEEWVDGPGPELGDFPM